MAVTATTSAITWNDGTTSTSYAYTGVVAVDTQSNSRPITTFAIGTYQLVRTSGFMQNNTQGGPITGAYLQNSTGLYLWTSAVLLPAVDGALYVPSTSTVTNDYNYAWYGWAYTGTGANPPAGTAALVGTWYSRGQMFGRGLVSANHGNFCLMQRVA